MIITDSTRTVPVLIYKKQEELDQPSEEKTSTVAETTFSKNRLKFTPKRKLKQSNLQID
jgi:hypothetical protein